MNNSNEEVSSLKTDVPTLKEKEEKSIETIDSQKRYFAKRNIKVKGILLTAGEEVLIKDTGILQELLNSDAIEHLVSVTKEILEPVASEPVKSVKISYGRKQ